MKKRFAKVFITVLCAACIFSGCGKKEEKKESSEKETKEVTKEVTEETLQIVGNKNSEACHVLITNMTEKNIVGLAVKQSDETEYPANMMKSDQKIENKEQFEFYYTVNEDKSSSEDEGKEQQSELADAEINLTYSLQISFEDNTVVELSSFAMDDMEETTLCFEDDVYFFKYKSISEKTEVTTKEMELMVKADKEKADAVLKQIESIGEVTLESEANLQSIRAAYDALTDVQKAKVTNLNKLTDAENKLAELKKNATENKAAENKAEEVTTSDTTSSGSNNSSESSQSSASEQPTAPEQSTDACLGDAEVNQPAAPEQSTDACLGDVEINQPAAPEQSTDGCLGDVEINQ